MSYIQNLFSSRDNNANAETNVGQTGRIWWDPLTNAFYYSDGNTAGGILITGGSSGNGIVGGSNTYVQYNNAGNFAGDSSFTFNSSTSTLTVTNIVAGNIIGGAGGTDTQVLFNDSGNINGNAQFTFNKATNTLTQTGTALLGNIYAVANNTSNIGSSTQRFNDIWLGSGNINLVDDTTNANHQIRASSGNVVFTGGNGLVFGQFAIYGNTISTIAPSANINIGLAGSTGYVNINRPLAVNSTGGGAPAFKVETTGLTEIRSYGNIAANAALLLINGTTTGNNQPRNFEGTLIQATGQNNSPARMSADAFGVDGTGQNAYASWAARVARGTVDSPSQTLAGDTMFRFTSQGYSNSGAYIGSIIRYNQVALENFATGRAGTRHNFAATPTGSATLKSIANIDGNGLTFTSAATGGPANIGITFQDGSYQNTAYIATNVVSSLTAGAGIQLSASTGNITIQNSGVLGVNGTTNQINVANVGNVLTLSLPQNLNTTANVQLNQLTVTDLIILGNVSNVVPSVVGGKIIYVANTATTYNDINVSGLFSGNAANNYSAGMLYDTASNTWMMDIGNSVGITANTIYADNIVANGVIQAGTVYATPIVAPTLVFRGDLSLDDVIGVGIQNHYQGADASTAFIAAPNNGIGPGGNYIITGINSNVYANADYAVAGANDGYVRVNGGNLVIDTETAGKVINFATGGVNATSYIRGTISDTGLSMVGNVTAGNMISTNATIGGVVSASGNITGGNLLIPSGIVSAAGNINGLNVNATLVSATGNIRGNNINTSGIISAQGNIVAGNLLIPVGTANIGNITAANIAAGNITSAIISATGNIVGPNVTATQLTATATLSATGNATVGNVLTNGIVSATGNVTGGNLVGQNLTSGRVAIVGSGKEVADDADFTYNSTTNVLSVAGNVNAAYFNGNIATTGNISTTGNVTGNYVIASGGNTVINAGISTTGNVTGNYFIGNGSTLTGVITSITPTALSSTVHVAAVTTGTVANIISDATTANTANTIVVRDEFGGINVNSWSINARTVVVNTTLTTTDYWIGCLAKGLTITLPNAANGAVQGRQYLVVDVVQSGNPGDTIVTQAGATVVGGSLSQQGQSKTCVFIAATDTWYCN